MTTRTTAKAEFSITGWDEQSYAEFDGTEKLTRTTTTQTYSGDLTGESRGDSLMYYGPADAPVSYVGLERFTCTVAGRTGTFVAQSHGTYANGDAVTTWFVVPGSGTGELAGIRGDGGYNTADGTEKSIPVTFDYYFEA
jgi:hypothetical protein